MRFILKILLCLTTIATAYFLWVTLQRGSLPYGEGGRYLDEISGIVYDEAGIMFYGLITLAFSLLTIILYLVLKRK